MLIRVSNSPGVIFLFAFFVHSWECINMVNLIGATKIPWSVLGERVDASSCTHASLESCVSRNCILHLKVGECGRLRHPKKTDATVLILRLFQSRVRRQRNKIAKRAKNNLRVKRIPDLRFYRKSVKNFISWWRCVFLRKILFYSF